MNTVYLIRHGATAGNLERRYIGRTNEELCKPGIAQVLQLQPPKPDHLFVSPMRRTRQTAELLFPDQPQTLVHDLQETDFGIFEAKTAAELIGHPAYQAWVAAGCETPIPGGEAVAQFKARCIEGFLSAMSTVSPGASAAFVIHGGCIMAILEALAVPKRQFYEYHTGNGTMITADFDGSQLHIRTD